MNRDFTLDRGPLPVPVATREILGGGGLKLHAREWGNPEGFPLLFIHGWSQSDLCWLNQVRGDLAGMASLHLIEAQRPYLQRVILGLARLSWSLPFFLMPWLAIVAVIGWPARSRLLIAALSM
jgi:hypothetical protein